MDASYLITFLIGLVVGARLKALADRSAHPGSHLPFRGHQRFKQVQQAMPKLIAEMKRDLSHTEHRSLREFFIVSKQMKLDSAPKRLCYFLEDHPGLPEKVASLETQGYVIRIAQERIPLYRMTEEFAALVLKS